ncbi:hypothetical protein CKM354_000630500 [Cercospora kikuchii]|uniref:Uncharacterized protein n=1 Tax=Cercospora kikuchii TaxID=84275 RepID=A0A9P3CH07_9PEZI|nr:uncharacterized protein CKM354_000630500 [Cercospora kikuchii]GIZ43062.1 hypothetical protein CKM354_000630500 [Cercospora kikuchii]
MRFLEVDDSDRFRLTKDFPASEIPRRYAILSHTWGGDGDEVSFHDMQQESGVDKPGFEKIRFCAWRARCDGIKYFWIDTCCINKNDPFELPKAINSMFRWYKEAEKCYVFLSDVPRDSKERVRDSGDWEKDFRRSRWFQRGWTLQELLAPASVEFFSRDGLKLGDKTSLEAQLCAITNIPVAALRGNTLSTFTKQERFSWQEGRQTKEEEDMIYSLLGIFDVSMPVIYGEGRRHARARLDREIEIARKGTDHETFSITFALAEVVETPHFVARERELQDIQRALRTDGARRSVTLHGLGGIGKTQLAIAYATRHREDYSGIFWINAKDEDSMKLSFARVAKRIAREHPSADAMRLAANSSNLDESVAAVKWWLSLANNTRWLIIYDNYDNPKTPDNADPSALNLRDYFPESYQGCLIITTRSSEVNFGQRMQIRKLESLDDSLAILSYHSERSALLNDSGAIELANKLDGLPLALATAGAYLRQTPITFADYCHLYEASWTKLQDTSPYLDSYEDRKLYSTWQISFAQIQERNKPSAELLRLWAYFDNEDIWFGLLCYPGKHSLAWLEEIVHDELDFHNTVRVLSDHGIVEANAPTRAQQGGYSMHSCVHSWTREVLNTKLDEDLARTALFCVAALVPSTDSDKWWLVEQRLINHANRQLSALANAKDPACWAFFRLGNLFYDQGKLGAAENMFNRTLQGQERELGPNHKWTLATVDSLGLLYVKQGKLVEAEKMYNRALQGYEKQLGPDHMETLSTCNNIGLLYVNQGKLAEAEVMYNRALQGQEKEPERTSTLVIVNNLGMLYDDQGKLGEAKKMYNRALRGYEKTLGLEHISTLEVVHNLGTLHVRQGELVEAERMYDRARQGCEKALGPDHSSTLDIISNLGVLYRKQGKLAEAEKMLRQALQGREIALGLDHKLTLDTAHSLGNVYACSGQEKLLDAERMFQRALQGFERILGPDHGSTLDAVHAMGCLYAIQEMLPEAEEMYKRLVSGQENHSVYVRDHLVTFEEELREIGADISALRRLQASDTRQREETEALHQHERDEPHISDQGQLGNSQVSDKDQHPALETSNQLQQGRSQASDEVANKDLRARDQRRHSVRKFLRRVGRRWLSSSNGLKIL